MGAIIRVSCESCHAEWSCHTGCGMKHGSLENTAPLFPKETEAVLMGYAQNNAYPGFDFVFHLSVCPDCGGIVSVPTLKLHENGTSYIGVCPDCGKKVRLVEDLSGTPCPVCGKRELTALETGRWD